jgi:hypothetical protein
MVTSSSGFLVKFNTKIKETNSVSENHQELVRIPRISKLEPLTDAFFYYFARVQMLKLMDREATCFSKPMAKCLENSHLMITRTRMMMIKSRDMPSSLCELSPSAMMELFFQKGCPFERSLVNSMTTNGKNIEMEPLMFLF